MIVAFLTSTSQDIFRVTQRKQKRGASTCEALLKPMRLLETEQTVKRKIAGQVSKTTPVYEEYQLGLLLVMIVFNQVCLLVREHVTHRNLSYQAKCQQNRIDDFLTSTL